MEGGGEQWKWSCLPGWVHYDYFNNGNIRRAFDEKSEFNEKFTDGAAIMTVQLHKQYRGEIGAVGPLPYHPRINIILIQKEQKLPDILREQGISFCTKASRSIKMFDFI